MMHKRRFDDITDASDDAINKELGDDSTNYELGDDKTHTLCLYILS